MIGEVTLTSGRPPSYYVDAKRAILRQPGFGALGELVAAEAAELGADAVGGMTMGADPIACAAISAPGADRAARLLRPQGEEAARPAALGRGPVLEPGPAVLIVEDVVTTGGSTVKAIERSSRRASRSSAPSASSTGSPAAARRSRPRAAPPTGRW